MGRRSGSAHRGFHRGEVSGRTAVLAVLKGISTGDFSEALSALVGPVARGLSSSTISREKATWCEEHQAWSKRDLEGKRYVYIGADGAYFTPCMDNDRRCMLVVIGVDEHGEKDVLAIEDGFWENTDSWRGSRAGAFASRRHWLLATGRRGSGWRRCAMSTLTRVSNAAGCTRRQTCWVRCPSLLFMRGPGLIFKISRWRRHKARPTPLSIFSTRPVA